MRLKTTLKLFVALSIPFMVDGYVAPVQCDGLCCGADNLQCDNFCAEGDRGGTASVDCYGATVFCLCNDLASSEVFSSMCPTE